MYTLTLSNGVVITPSVRPDPNPAATNDCIQACKMDLPIVSNNHVLRDKLRNPSSACKQCKILTNSLKTYIHERIPPPHDFVWAVFNKFRSSARPPDYIIIQYTGFISQSGIYEPSV